MEKISKLILGMIVSLSVLSCTKIQEMKHLQTGETIPEFKTYTISGKNTGNDKLKGKPSVIILFSTTCPDCHVQLPEIESLWYYGSEVINVLAIARGEKTETVSDFWNKCGFTMPVAIDTDRTIYNLFDRGSKSGIPQVYITDQKGTVIGYGDWREPLTTSDILKKIQSTLNNQ